MKKLAIVTTHPIQYYAPVFQLLAQRGYINIKVFYTWGKQALDNYDPGFRKTVSWNIPLLTDYDYEWAVNTARQPGSHHFNGIVTPKLVNQIEAYHPDAVLVIGWAYRGHLAVMRHFNGKVPVYFRGDSHLLDKKSIVKHLFQKLLLKWVYSHVDHAFYPGMQSKLYFKEFGMLEPQLTLAPHAIDNDRFAAPRTAEAAIFRQKLNIPADDIMILFAGKLEEKKDPMLLLKAFKKITTKGKHLVFVGSGELEAALKTAAENAENIHFVDFVNQADMPVVYQACDVFCLPSKGPGETWGLAVNEAMAAGKAVFVSDKVGCAVDLVSPANGCIFPSGKARQLAEYLTLYNKKGLAKMGKSSAKIIAKLNFTRIAEAIEHELNTH